MSVERRRKLSRFAAVAVIGGFAGACSSDTMRLSGSPFSNPFASKGRGSEPTMTGSIPAAPRSAVQSQPLPALPAPKRLDTATFGQGRQADAGRPGQALAKPEPVKMQAIPEPQKFAK